MPERAEYVGIRGLWLRAKEAVSSWLFCRCKSPLRGGVCAWCRKQGAKRRG